MNCLKNYIGIKGCGSAPESGQYLNQLPGISLERVQKIANSEQVTFLGVFDEVQDRSWRRLCIDFRNRLRAKYEIKTLRRVYGIQATDSGETIAASANYKGVIIDSGLDSNGLFSFKVNAIILDLPQATANVVVKIFDRYGIELDSFTIVNGVEGPNIISVNETYAASMLFIGIDATAVILKRTTVKATEPGYGFDTYISDSFGCECNSAVYGGESLIATPGIIGNVSTTFGIAASISATCDFAAMICRDKELFIDAWMNILGAELMVENMYSDAINKYTTVDVKDAEELMGLFTGQYLNALDELIDGIRINQDDACIECKEVITRRERLP